MLLTHAILNIEVLNSEPKLYFFLYIQSIHIYFELYNNVSFLHYFQIYNLIVADYSTKKVKKLPKLKHISMTICYFKWFSEPLFHWLVILLHSKETGWWPAAGEWGGKQEWSKTYKLWRLDINISTYINTKCELLAVFRLTISIRPTRISTDVFDKYPQNAELGN